MQPSWIRAREPFVPEIIRQVGGGTFLKLLRLSVEPKERDSPLAVRQFKSG
jgi:hypothetical protein